jgi:hypothetical protein
LVFAPEAWLTLEFMCHRGPTEVGGFGVSSAEAPLYVEHFHVVRQHCTSVTTCFDDEGVADHFDQCVDQGLRPGQFGRIWCHTHPNASATPSWTDEENFARCFGGCEWSVMFILSRTSRTYARVSFNAVPGFQVEIPVRIDWRAWPRRAVGDERLDPVIWDQEYRDLVQIEPEPRLHSAKAESGPNSNAPLEPFWLKDFNPALLKGG